MTRRTDQEEDGSPRESDHQTESGHDRLGEEVEERAGKGNLEHLKPSFLV